MEGKKRQKEVGDRLLEKRRGQEGTMREKWLAWKSRKGKQKERKGPKLA